MSICHQSPKVLQGISNITNTLHLMRNMFDIIFVFDVKAFPKREASMERQIRQLPKVKKNILCSRSFVQMS